MTSAEKRRSSKSAKKSPVAAVGKDLAAKERASAVVEKFKAWRTANKLSQRQAAAVMVMHDLPVSIPSIQSWEQGVQLPGMFAAKALETFLEQHPKITDAPVYGRWKSPNKDVAEIHKLRKTGMTLLSIAQRFGISESAVSRICAGHRRAKAELTS
jgi:transcriptional regulator with XRE-family HTH domain